MTFKRPSSRARARIVEDAGRHRARWRAYQGRIDPRRLIFIDEGNGQDQHDPAARLEAKEESRLVDIDPHARASGKQRRSLPLFAMDRIDAPCLFDGPIQHGEAASAPMSSSSSSRPSKPGERCDPRDNHWALTERKKRCARRSAMFELASCFCRNTPEPSTRSSRSSPN